MFYLNLRGTGYHITITWNTDSPPSQEKSFNYELHTYADIVVGPQRGTVRTDSGIPGVKII